MTRPSCERGAKTNPAGDYTCGACSFFVRHQAGLSIWAFTHCSVSIVGGGPGLYSGPWLRIRRSPVCFPVESHPCLRTLLLNGFRPPGGRIGASRDVPAALETRSPPDLSRSNYRASGAPGKCCGCRNSFSQRQKRAPQTAQRQPETAAEILCEVRKYYGTWPSH